MACARLLKNLVENYALCGHYDGHVLRVRRLGLGSDVGVPFQAWRVQH